MKKDLEKALGQIDLPENLESDVRKGVDRALAEKRGISLTRSFKHLAAAAVIIIVAAVGFGLYSFTKPPALPDGAALRFMGFKPGTTDPVVVEMSAEGKIIGQVMTDGITLKNESGETVDPDGIFLLSTYWLDENGELRFTDIPVGGYLMESEINGKSYELLGFSTEDYGNRIIFDPADGYLGSAEEGTAYDAEEGELEISLEKVSEGTYRFIFTPRDGDKYPFSETAEYYIDAISGFSAEPTHLGGCGPQFLSSGVGGELSIDGGRCVIDRESNTLKISDGGELRWLRIRSAGALLGDGRKIEIHGDWVIKVEF